MALDAAHLGDRVEGPARVEVVAGPPGDTADSKAH